MLVVAYGPVSVLTERVAMLRLNMFNGPLSDPKLRRALWHAIDRDTIVQANRQMLGEAG